MSETKIKNPIYSQWLPENKGIFATNSGEGLISIYNYHDAMNPELVKNTKQSPDLLAPNWLKNNSSINYGYSGKMLTFTNNLSENTSKLAISKNIYINQELVSKIREFDKMLEEKNLAEICQMKSDENSEQNIEKIIWLFMKGLALNNKCIILNALGFDPNKYFYDKEHVF